ncbi:YxiJ family protein [Terribacillus saccharophilus]|uniref:YxiJ family protein n=1 Tax=Terribacillus saccharophilus TaxID=361277 RepID=UPI003982B5C2
MKEGKYIAMPVSYHHQLIQVVVRERWTKTVSELLALRLMEPFPYTGLRRIIENYTTADELDLADWNTHWMEIGGAVQHLIRSKLPEKNLINWCSLNFFSRHPEWSNQNDVIMEEYPVFHREYMGYERARFYVLFFHYQWTAGRKYLK